MKLHNLGESGLIHLIRQRFAKTDARLGIGDDAAIFDVPPGMSIIYCSDLVAENTHFIRKLHPADSIAYKAVAVNVSDVGAMGGIPKYFTLSVALPGDLETTWVNNFLDGLARACDDFKVQLLGGDSSSSERIFVDVSMIGWIESGKEVRRSGAQIGDGIYITGALGASALGLDELRAGNPNHPAVTKHLYPSPRHHVGRVVASEAHAMMDISDGLSTDLHHIIEESNVSARIYRDRIPGAAGTTDAHVLHGGEDYELLIIAPALPAEIEGVSITRVGEITTPTTSPQIVLVDGSTETLLQAHGYEHFRGNSVSDY